MTGGELVVQSLVTHGVERAFCVPGESYLAVIDALYEVRNRLDLIVCRHEAGAANMAEAYGKMTGRPGVCMVTRGPGATHASIGVHTAFQDSTPMLLLVGQVGSDFAEREAFQEVDYRRMFGQMVKWVAQIDRPDRVAEMMSHAFHLAVSGRPGPVVLALPEDMLTARAQPSALRPYQRVTPAPSAQAMSNFREVLKSGTKPLVLMGGGGWTAKACEDMMHFARANSLPLSTSFRCQDLIDNDDPNYAGHVGIGPSKALADLVREADPLIVVGARLGEMTTSGYTLVTAPVPRQRMVHVHPGAEELGRVYQADLLINSGMPEFASALVNMPPVDATAWKGLVEHAHASDQAERVPSPTSDRLDMAQVVLQLQAQLGKDVIVTNGAGNYSGWAHRYWRYGGYRSQLGPTSGAMGYGLPAAISAKMQAPGREVVCFAGDGCFLMSGQELATAQQYGVRILVLVVNNSSFGTIRMHQEREYPRRVWGTAIENPDFAALARAYGGHGETVEATEDFLPALERCQKAETFSLIELKIQTDQITTRTTIEKIRELSDLGRRS
jgi:acetolactate synthase-1/2/3 large subunit